ncbi:MAG: acyl-CoA dehydrogenase family protein [Solirubrobacterales bacterium]
MVSFELTQKQNQLIEEIRTLAPAMESQALQLDEAGDDRFDFSLVNILARENLLTPTVAVEYGGRGIDAFTCALYMEEIGAVCAGLATVVSYNLHAASFIDLFGSQEQKQYYLPRLTQKKPCLAAIAATEPGAGSDIGAMTASAKLDDGQYVINGTKEYLVNGTVADFIICFATLDPSRARSTMAAFLVPGSADGLEVAQIRRKMGIRYAHTCQMRLNNLAVPARNLLGEVGSGYLMVTQEIDRSKVLIGATGVGLARSAFEKALAYARERRQFGRSIYENQALSFTFAKMAAQIEAARLLVWKACWLIDRNDESTMASSMAKIAGTTAAVDVVGEALDIMGGYGYIKGNSIEKLYRDAKILPTLEGTNDIHNAVITSLL